MPKVTLTALPLGSERLLSRTTGQRHRVGDEFEVTDRELQVLQEQPGVEIDVVTTTDGNGTPPGDRPDTPTPPQGDPPA